MFIKKCKIEVCDHIHTWLVFLYFKSLSIRKVTIASYKSYNFCSNNTFSFVNTARHSKHEIFVVFPLILASLTYIEFLFLRACMFINFFPVAVSIVEATTHFHILFIGIERIFILANINFRLLSRICRELSRNVLFE